MHSNDQILYNRVQLRLKVGIIARKLTGFRKLFALKAHKDHHKIFVQAMRIICMTYINLTAVIFSLDINCPKLRERSVKTQDHNYLYFC